MTDNRGRKWYHWIDNFKLPGRQFSFFNFKGAPSREEPKTVHNVFTVESALTGLVRFLRSSVSPSGRWTVPRCPHTATVRRATLPYIFLCWLVPIDGDDLSVQYTGTGLYSSCTVPMWHRAVALRCRRGTVQRF